MSHWAIVPYIDCLDLTHAAISDALAQDIGDVKVLAVAQGYEGRTRNAMENWANLEPRLFNFFYDPPLLSLSAVWNRALRMVWETGATEAWVLNNDTRCKPATYRVLRDRLIADSALFVSGVGVTQEQFEGAEPTANDSKGGPDFSCFVISRECHEKYPFDEMMIPAYCDDCDLHRRIMLNGEGARIYSIDVPYWHVDQGSGTLKSFSPEKRAAWERRIEQGARAHYRAKWGGGINAERFRIPFNDSPEEGITNAELFEQIRSAWRA